MTGETQIASCGPGPELRDGLPPPGAAAIREGDALALLAELPAGCVPCAIFSPPYNGGASPSAREHPHSSRGPGKNWQGYGADPDCVPEAEYQAQQIALLTALHRVCSDQASVFYIHRPRHWDGRCLHPWAWLQHSPWVIRQEIVVDYGTTHQRAGYYFDPCSERCYWLRKDTATVQLGALARYTDVWRLLPADGPAWHPAPTSYALAARCVLAGSAPGDLVLDPYCGSATVGVAALENGRRFLGMERQACYIGPARARLATYRLPLPLAVA